MQQKLWIRAGLALVGLGIVGGVVRWRTTGDAHAATGRDPSPSASADERVVPVVAVMVEKRDVPIYLEGLGSVTAFNTVTVHAQVDGRLDRVAFREGQDVHKGDLLAQIDPRSFTIKLHQAEASLTRDRATLHGHRTALDRDLALRKDGLATQQQVDDEQSAVDQAAAVLVGDQTQIEAARLDLDYARVTAPSDGVTGVRLVDPGNVVRAVDPTGLVVIAQIDPIAVLFTLPEDDLPRITKAMAEGTVAVDAMSRDGTSKLGQGQLALVDNQINQATATIKLKALFPNPGRSLWPNQFVKARVLLTTRKGALVVPASVVQRGPQGTFAYVIGADQKVVARPVQLESTEGDLAVVGGGLELGERVVEDGQNQLRPGSRVSTAATADASARAAPSGTPPSPTAAKR